MAIFKCKMCGGDLNVAEGTKITECEYCGSMQTIPDGNDEKKATLFNRANRLRMDNEFDKAAGVYESIVSEFPEEAEGYWGLVLCSYGIEYVDDAKTGKKIPTCHRTLTSSVMDDDNFNQACENADAVARGVYREEAKAIDRLQQQIIAVVENEEPYDIFICYKETDDITKQRTEDSQIAQDIYTELIKEGYKVFFSRVTLRDKAGTEYEPYIYAALKSAKLMLAIGTKFDYYDAVWVKNEWSRYISMMSDDSSKHLIPCFKNLDAYDIPKEFKNLQALDMGEVTFFKSLLTNVERFVPKKTTTGTIVSDNASGISGTAESLVKRAFMFLEEGMYDKADEYCEKVLDINPECGDAYLVKMLIEYKIPGVDEMAKINTIERDLKNAAEVTILPGQNKMGIVPILKQDGWSLQDIAKFLRTLPQKLPNKNSLAQKLEENEIDFSVEGEVKGIVVENVFELAQNTNYLKVLKYNSSAITSKAVEYVEAAVERESESLYKKALKELNSASCISAYNRVIDTLNAIPAYKDSASLMHKCREEIENIIENTKKKYKILFKKPKVFFGSSQGTLVALKSDGTVAGSNPARFNVGSWSNIASISISDENVVGLKSNGTVVSCYGYGADSDLSMWFDIVDVSAGFGHVVALKADGTVFACGSNRDGQCNVSGWTDIIKIIADSYGTVGLKSDGSVLVTGDFYACSLSGFEDAADYCAETNRTPSKEMVLMSDGTVKSIHKEYSTEASDWRNIVAISSGHNHTIGLRADGTVVATHVEEYEDNGQCNVSSWQDVVAVDTADFDTMGLKSDGTMLYAGQKGDVNLKIFTGLAMPVSGSTAKEIFDKRVCGMNESLAEKRADFYKNNARTIIRNMQSSVSAGREYTIALKEDGTLIGAGNNINWGACKACAWNNIKAISASDTYVIGLKNDGTVVSAKHYNVKTDYCGQGDVSHWRDIVAIAAGGYHTVGLKSDGTVVTTKYTGDSKKYCKQCEVAGWTDIVAISAGTNYTVGLKSDGTVVSAGTLYPEPTSWTDIVAVCSGSDHIVGIKSDGTVVATGLDVYGQCDVSDWKDIVAVSAGRNYTVGIKKDGTVVSTEYTGNPSLYNGQCNVSGWKDIVAISAGTTHTIGVKKDGTIMATPYKHGDAPFIKVGKWKDIMLPIHADTQEEYEAERKKRIDAIEEQRHMAEELRLRQEEQKHLEQQRLEQLRQLQMQRRNSGLCQHCGGQFKGVFTKTCVNCGKKKDY